jgi:hypothetical protein
MMAAWYSRRREIVSLPAAVYRLRNPQGSDYYHCVEDYFDTFVRIYDDHFSRQYGFWRPYLEKVIYGISTVAICTTALLAKKSVSYN